MFEMPESEHVKAGQRWKMSYIYQDYIKYIIYENIRCIIEYNIYVYMVYIYM